MFVSATTIYKVYFLDSSYHTTMDKDDVDRNESSTPRSFVLPATPAVAEEQERKRLERLDGINAEKCLSKMQEYGYKFDDLNASFNAKFIEAILDFQDRNLLDKTGVLDDKTRNVIGCK